MKKWLLAGMLFLMSFFAHGTPRRPDIVIYKGDTLKLNSWPLDNYLITNQINSMNLFGGASYCTATWEIIDNKLYMVRVKNAGYPISSDGDTASYKHISKKIGKEYADLKALFPSTYKDEKVFADWVTQELYIQFGEMLYYSHGTFGATYEYEYKLSVRNGVVEKKEKLDNTQTKTTIYSNPPYNNKDTLRRYIQSQIQWENLPSLPNDSIVKVNVSFVANENGMIDSVWIFRKNTPEIFANEAIRIVKTIPWRAVYLHGKHVKEHYTMPIWFRPPLKGNKFVK